ncbi:unnamed protein product [Discula destructiva]
MDSTILIIGAGTFGVSTAWHLSQNHNDPSKVTIIDREAAAPTTRLAAAADINRIVTADYPCSPLYADLAREALAFWAEDPDLEWYFHKTGRLVLTGDDDRGGGGGGGSGGGDGRLFADPQSEVALDEVGKRWGVLDGTDKSPFRRAYFDADAGWVDAATATWQFLETAVRRRVRREVGDVVELLFDPSRRKITGARTADGRIFRADRVVLATGAWTSALLSPVEDALGVADGDRVERQARATALVSAAYPVSREEVRRIAGCGMPCVVFGDVGEVVPASAENGMLRYNLTKTRIANTVRTKGGTRISLPPARRSQEDVPEQLKVDMKDTLSSRLMPEFAKAKPKWRLCWDNCSPTEDLLLCEHPQLQDCFIITGGSFNGYKFMPNIGKYMINVLKRQSNGREMDEAWGWKSRAEIEAARGGYAESRELQGFLSIDSVPKL